ncbi:hypothetical protein CDAR_481391 [Caerostris darwini]|uniref:Uncharacterized protein n=1 Tax=Caerostris darwini TaxID=1538125 RepID=A0AAV4N8V5_9ARAC|nr:hypothetical protein CDAR_481391 [Caerostris darwini]
MTACAGNWFCFPFNAGDRTAATRKLLFPPAVASSVVRWAYLFGDIIGLWLQRFCGKEGNPFNKYLGEREVFDKSGFILLEKGWCLKSIATIIRPSSLTSAEALPKIRDSTQC